MAYVSDHIDFNKLLGGDSGLVSETESELRRGVFARYPAATPKYSTSNADAGLQTMARLLVPLESVQAYEDFCATFTSPETQKLAMALGAPEGLEITTGNPGDAVSSTAGLGYIDFLLVQVQENFQEKVQVVDVLSDNFVAFFFGSQPPVFTFSGALLNTLQDDWRTAFTIIYNDIIRGTQLARRQRMATVAYDNIAVSGALLTMTQVLTAESQMMSQFNFQMLVQRVDVVRTENHPPTGLSKLPRAVKPAEFAIEQISLPPKTIRAVYTPSASTETRKKPSEPEQESFLSLESPSASVYGSTPEEKSAEKKFNPAEYDAFASK